MFLLLENQLPNHHIKHRKVIIMQIIECLLEFMYVICEIMNLFSKKKDPNKLEPKD